MPPSLLQGEAERRPWLKRPPAQDLRQPGALVVEIQYHSPDQAFCAGLLRDGEPWILDGALTGMHTTSAGAVENLIDTARYLVIHGENGWTETPLSLADREWLFSLLDIPALDPDGEMYAAIQAAREAAQKEEPHG